MEAGTRSSGAAWRSAWQVAGRHPTGRKGSTRHPPSAPSSPPSSAASLAASALARSTASCATKNAKKIRMGPGWASGTRQAWLQSKPAPRLRARQQPSRMLAPPPPPACNDRGWCVACLQLADHRRHLQVGASGLQEIADVGLQRKTCVIFWLSAPCCTIRPRWYAPLTLQVEQGLTTLR